MRIRGRRRLAAAIIVPVSMLVALLAWAVASPPGASPDDDYHMASIWCANGPVQGQCELTDSDARAVPEAIFDVSACYVFASDRSAACPVDEGSITETLRGNWVDEAYPPLFYWAMSAFVGPDIQTSVLLMRAANVMLYVGLITALFFTLPQALRPPLAWGTMISIAPLGMFLVASVNPSAWAVISASGLWVAAWGWFVQSGWRKWAVGTLAATFLILGAGARADAAIFGVLALVVAAVLAFERTRRYFAHLIPVVVLAVGAVVAFFSTGQSSSLASDTAPQDGSMPISTLTFTNLQRLPDLWAGAFDHLGWLDTEMPAITSVTAVALFSAIVFWGLRSGGPRKWLAIAGLTASLVIVPMAMLLLNDVVVGQWVQSRYIYPMIIMLGGVALVGLARPTLGLRRTQLAVVGTALVVAESMALHANIRRYTTGADVLNFNLNAPIEWWWNTPVQPMTVWLLGTLCFALVLVCLMVAAWDSPGSRTTHAGNSEVRADPGTAAAPAS